MEFWQNFRNEGQKGPIFSEVYFCSLFLSKDRLGLFDRSLLKVLELGGVTSLIRSAVRFFKAGHLKKIFLMVQSHERSLKPISAA